MAKKKQARGGHKPPLDTISARGGPAPGDRVPHSSLAEFEQMSLDRLGVPYQGEGTGKFYDASIVEIAKIASEHAIDGFMQLQEENKKLRAQVLALGGKAPAEKPVKRLLRLPPELDRKLLEAVGGKRGAVSAFIRRAIRHEISRDITKAKKSV